MPLVAMHWQHRFNHMVGRYNDIYRVQMPNITPHVCLTYLLLQYGEIGNEPQDATVPYGAFGYFDHDECVHAYQL